jgi:SAM-dependent methyltransferase
MLEFSQVRNRRQPLDGEPWPSPADICCVFLDKHGSKGQLGWSPARRLKAGYYLPAEIYEATVAKHAFPGCTWIDVGGGHSLFPENRNLALTLAKRCTAVVAVDPDPAVHDNVAATETHRCIIEEYRGDRRFDLATFRMVVEHVVDPDRVVRALSELMRPGAAVIVLTVNRWSPISIASRLLPFALHHPIKRLFWGGEERDTFPVQYRMNTRAALRGVFQRRGFREIAFAYLDDLSTFGQFKRLGSWELAVWSRFAQAGIVYPENCLLGIYQLSTS